MKKDYQAAYRDLIIKTTDGSTIYGKVHLGGKTRISDIFISSEIFFIVMVDVSYEENISKTMFINKRHIVWAKPETE